VAFAVLMLRSVWVILSQNRINEDKETMEKVETPSWGKWGTWVETESFLDKEIGLSVGCDKIEMGSIRRWLEPKEFDCPLHYDEKVAKEAGYKGVVAPYSMVMTFALDAYWKPGAPQSREGDPPKQISLPVLDVVPAPCTLSFATDIEIEFFTPMYIGDRVTCRSKLVDIKYKELKVGKGAFLKQESKYTNQSGELLAVMYMTIFRFAPPDGKEG